MGGCAERKSARNDRERDGDEMKPERKGMKR